MPRRRTEPDYDELMRAAREAVEWSDDQDREAGVKPTPDEGPVALIEEARDCLETAIEGEDWELVAEAQVRLEQLAEQFERPALRIYDPDAEGGGE